MALSGCLAPPRPLTPMPATWEETVPGQRQDTLLVFLPGRHDEPEDFLENGFLEEMRSTGLPADAVFTGAHLGYYYKQTLPERLETDILRPAREMGYRHIWVVGISLGGLGAVLFDQDVPGWWDGIVLIAPFVGDKQAILDRVRAAPSLSAAELPESYPSDDYTAKFWQWVQAYQADPDRPLLLALGRDDRMRADQTLLARDLPPQQVMTVDGNHSWPVWRELWWKLVPLIQHELRPAD